MPLAIRDRNQFLSELSATELAVLRPHLVDFDITAGDACITSAIPLKGSFSRIPGNDRLKRAA
jgi:hypothetical protein